MLRVCHPGLGYAARRLVERYPELRESITVVDDECIEVSGVERVIPKLIFFLDACENEVEMLESEVFVDEEPEYPEEVLEL